MQDRDMVLIFLFILMRRDMTIDDAIMDCFQVFEKFHEFLFETHMMCVVYIASVLCAVWQRDFLYWTALYYQRFSTRGDFVSQGTFGNTWSHFRLSRLV